MALMAVMTISAQRMVRVVGNVKDTVEVWRVDQIYFITDTVKTLKDTPDTIDLGLKVRWADRNMGAKSPKDPGLLIGWGDTTLTNLSTKLQYFPIENISTNISNSNNYDVAKIKWDNAWHMPTEADMNELIAACNWEWISRNDSTGVLGKLKTDETKTIFFPATGYREGEADPAEETKGYYWTGIIAGTSGENTKKAKYMGFADGSAPAIANELRYMGLAIRPVTDPLAPAKVPTSIANVTMNSITASSAKVVVTLDGDLDDIQDNVVVSYGTSENNLNQSKTGSKATTITINLSGLTQNTTYYLKVTVPKTAGGQLESSVLSITTIKDDGFPVPEYVDLGLPSGTLWAKWNMGSKGALHVPTDKTKVYYVFGEPDPTNHSGAAKDHPFYKSSYSAGTYDIGGTEYDIATVMWGPEWRTPTGKQFQELSKNKNLTWTFGTFSEDGYSCVAYKVTSKITGEYLYFPAQLGEVSSTGQNKATWYWTSENESKGSAYSVQVQSIPDVSSNQFTKQFPIRPIYVGPKENNNNENQGGEGGNENQGGEGNENQGGESGDDNGNTTPDNAPDDVKAIDLGLSVKWASKNLGAKYVSSAGNYYAWGDTIPNRASYSKDTYIYKDASDTNGMKYLGTFSDHSSSYNIGGTEYDAARREWGGNWRMPTMQEMRNLIDQCTWTYTSQTDKDGVVTAGYEITRAGYSDKLFLPCVGEKRTGSYDSNNAYYWTDEIYSSIPSSFNKFAFALSVNTNTNSIDIEYEGRQFALPIRPVLPK